MKKEKTIEVTLCDFCHQERDLYTCACCGNENCGLHVRRFGVTVDPMGDGFAASNFFDFCAVFCVECADSVESALRALRFVQYRTVPANWLGFYSQDKAQSDGTRAAQ